MSSSSKLSILVAIEDFASKEIKRVGESLEGLNGQLESMRPAFESATRIGTIGFAAVAGAVGLSVASYADAERAQRQLEHAVIAVSKGTKEQADSIAALADALQAKVGVDGDAIKMGAAQLSTFGLQTESVKTLTKSLADLTVNQSGVNATSDDYIQSANTIAKALNGQFGILEKSGIRFTEAQQKIIMFGKESEKVAALQEGFAQNLRETTDTLGGIDVAAARAKTSLGEISESFGKLFSGIAGQTLTAMTPFLNSIQQFIEAHPKLVVGITITLGAIFLLISAFGMLGLAALSVTSGLAALTTASVFFQLSIAPILGTITLVIAIITALVAVGYLLYKNWDDIKAGAEIVWGGIKDAVSTAMNAIGSVFTAVWEGIKAALMFYVNFTIGLWATLLDFLFPGWDKTLKSIWAKTLEIFAQIKEFFTKTFADFSSIISIGLDTISNTWNTVWGNIKDFFIGIWDPIKNAFSSATDWITNTMDKVMGPIQKVIDLASRALSLAGSAVSSTVSSITGRGSQVTGARAAGGPVTSGSSFLVGEHGPEIFTPSSSGSIVNFGGGLAAAGAPITINIDMSRSTFLDENVANQIGNAVIKRVQRGHLIGF